MTYSVPSPSDETNASRRNETSADTREVGSDGAEVRRDAPAGGSDVIEPSSDVQGDVDDDRSAGIAGGQPLAGPNVAGVVPAAVIPEDTAERAADVSGSGDTDAALRVPHDAPEDWEDQFVQDPEAAKEATRARMDEQMERERSDRGAEAGGSTPLGGSGNVPDATVSMNASDAAASTGASDARASTDASDAAGFNSGAEVPLGNQASDVTVGPDQSVADDQAAWSQRGAEGTLSTSSEGREWSEEEVRAQGLPGARPDQAGWSAEEIRAEGLPGARSDQPGWSEEEVRAQGLPGERSDQPGWSAEQVRAEGLSGDEPATYRADTSDR